MLGLAPGPTLRAHACLSPLSAHCMGRCYLFECTLLAQKAVLLMQAPLPMLTAPSCRSQWQLTSAGCMHGHSCSCTDIIMCVAALLYAELQSLPSYVCVCERLGLRNLWEGLVDYCSREEVWQQLQHPPHKAVLQHLQRRHARLYTAVMQQRHRGGGGAPPAAAVDAADAAMSLLGPAAPASSRA